MRLKKYFDEIENLQKEEEELIKDRDYLFSLKEALELEVENSFRILNAEIKKIEEKLDLINKKRGES